MEGMMPKVVDLTNAQFGELTVTWATQERGRGGGRIWRAICRCGKEAFAVPQDLRNMRTCGHAQKGHKYYRTDDPVSSLYNSNIVLPHGYKGYTTPTISLEAYRTITGQNCTYCNKAPSLVAKWSGYIYQGVDRVDNDLGYEPGNCVSCCSMCNQFKKDYQQRAFLDHALAIVLHSFSSYKIEHALWKKAEDEE